MKRVLMPLLCLRPACALLQKPPRPVHAPPLLECLNHRESYEVAAAPASQAVVLVSIIPNPDACDISTAPI